MPLAVRFDNYGDIDVLKVVEVSKPVPGEGEVLIRVVATGINPGEASIRKGLLHPRFPATFPSGEGSDLAGIVASVGPDVSRFGIGDEVLGFVDTRGSHAEFVVVDVDKLVSRPATVPWEAAGSLFVAGTVEMAIELGVAPERVDTIIDWAAAEKYGTKTDGTATAANAEVLAELAGLIAEGRLEIPIAKKYPLTEVREAFRDLEQRHTLGKIVLEP